MRTSLSYFLISLLLAPIAVGAGLEDRLLRVLTSEQAQAYADGLAPEDIDLPNGETLAEYLIRQERKGRASLVLRALEPCVVLDTSKAVEKPASGYPFGLLLRGEARDLSSYGGSSSGCGIPDLVGIVFRHNRARALLLSVEIRNALESGFLAFESTGSLVRFRPGELATALSLIVPLCIEENVDPCAQGDLGLLLKGQAEVEITVHGYLEPLDSVTTVQAPDNPGSEESAPESTASKAAGDTPWVEGADNIHYLDGKVGIGTSSPNSLLVVTGDSAVGGEPKAAATIDAAGNTSTDWALSLRASSAPGQVDDLMMVRGDGRVGIGTKSPITDFHLEGQGYISGDLVLENSSMIRGREALSGTAAGAAFFNSATPGSSDIDTNPGYGGYLLHNLFWDGTQWVQPRGDMYSQAFTVGHHYDASWWRAAPSGTNGSGVSLNRSMVIKRNTGNVGIGSPSPASSLVVSQNGFSGHSDWAVSFDSRTSDASTGVLHLRNSNAESVLFARSDGRVGIGTEEPQKALHIDGGFLLRDSNDLGILAETLQRSPSGYASGSAHDSQVLKLTTAYESASGALSRSSIVLGSPEIWGAESAYLYGFGSKNIRLGAINDSYRRAEIEIFNDNTSQGKILFRTGTWQDPANVPGNETNVRMLIDHSGKVGIGTTAPVERLEVDGNVKVSGNIQLSGYLVGDGDICIGQCG